MAAIPHIIISDGDEFEVVTGDLITIPAEFFSKDQIRFYRRAPVGWSVCPLGYNFFAGNDSLNRRIVFPGIVFPERDQKRRRFPNYQLKFSKNQIEKYIRPHFQRVDDLRAERDLLYRNLTHDLRAISTEIYNEALEAREIAVRKGNGEAIRAMDNVLAAQQMMSVRLDVIDYESGQFSSKKPANIKVFKKLEKVYLCFRQKIERKNLHSHFTGNSFSEIVGPDILEIAFFVLIENAIKYSPEGSTIGVQISESMGQVHIVVNSLGPCVASNERSKIFDRGYRGKAAERVAKAGGSGIGLFAAKSIVVGQFNGSIEIDQEDERTVFNGLNYYLTSFRISLPISRLVENKSFRRRRMFRGRRFGSRVGGASPRPRSGEL